MKKLIIGLMATVLSLTIMPVELNATEKEKPAVSAPAPIRTEESKALELRIAQINAMDKTILSKSEKRELRREVKSIDKKVKKSYHQDGVVFISGGTLLLIIILLIIFL